MTSRISTTASRPYLRSLLVAALLVSGVLFWVVPQFKPVLEASRITPSSTILVLIKCSDWVVNYFYLILAVPLLGWLVIQLIERNSSGKNLLTGVTRRITLMGKYTPS